jgi:hypothetical protein
MFSIFVYSHRSFIRLFHGQKGEKPMFFVSFSCLSPHFLISSQDLKNMAKKSPLFTFAVRSVQNACWLMISSQTLFKQGIAA